VVWAVLLILSLCDYIGVWGGAPCGGPGGTAPSERVRGKPLEAESSIVFKAPAEEPNVTLVTHSFLQFT